ncbi:hypothetical protein L5515_003014 [Caenorhabditis briggsae]|uniref:PNPLA domain-containing protein n=1 Tax=Caenorhabditis briggsae TaxID=6238 RepID=A0AAE9EKT6_CAEBR|nr:hypothetical protein L5515_003014 [Caenorhabditis briggsae]
MTNTTGDTKRYPDLNPESLGPFSEECPEEVYNNFLITFGDYSNPEETQEDRKSAGSNDETSEKSPTSSDSVSESNKENEEPEDKKKKEMDELEIRKKRQFPLRKARDPANRTPLQDASQLCLSFGGCGFLGSYQFGAAKMIYDHGKELLKRVDRYSGCSSGSLVTTMLIFNPEKISEAVEEIYKMADEVNETALGAMSPGFVIGDRLRKVVERFVPDDISKANDLLFVSVTRVKTWKNELISHFHSKSDLIDCLMASCYHPMYSSGLSGKAPILRGEPYIDGGYSNILPEFLDKRTVSVTAFAGDADICPTEKSALFNDWMFAFFNQNMKVTFSNMKRVSNALFPPPRGMLQQYFDAGAKDAEKLLKEAGMYE